VLLDAFFLSHTYEPVDIPDQETVDKFLPPLLPRFQLDTGNPEAFNQFVAPQAYMEMRYNIQMAMEQVPENFGRIAQEFEIIFGRPHNPADAVQCEDAEIVLVTAGTTVSTCRQAVNHLRRQGEKAGLIKLKMFRPFPVDFLRQVLNGKQKVAVVDRNCSFGASGIFAQEQLQWLTATVLSAPRAYLPRSSEPPYIKPNIRRKSLAILPVWAVGM
jgi:pyruvate/2-oxoacid:ferredoxin oxidoreductase alpha subunit